MIEEDQGWLPNAPAAMEHENNSTNREIYIHISKNLDI